MGRNSKAKGDHAKSDPYMDLAQHLRTKHGVEWRAGIANGERVEYFRGKDFAAYLNENPDQMENLPGIEPLKIGRTISMQIEEVHNQMARRRFFLRGARMHKKPKPGRKKLVKFPKKIVYEQDQSWDEEAFYCWTFDRPTSPWLWVGSLLLVVVVFLMCLFPLAPYSVKISVVYLSMSLLGLIFGILLIRGIVFTIVFILFGKFFWLLPNITSEELGIIESFHPYWAITLGEDGNELPSPGILSRLGVGAFVALTIFALQQHAPEVGQVKTNLGRAHDSFLEMLNLHDPGQMKLADLNMNETNNATMGMNGTGGFNLTGEPQQADAAFGEAAEDAGSADNIEKILEELDEELGEGEVGEEGEEAQPDQTGEEGEEEEPDQTGDVGEEAQPGEAAEENKHTEL